MRMQKTVDISTKFERNTEIKTMNYHFLTAIGIGFIFLMSVLGAASVYCFKKEISPRIQTVFLGFSSGIMLAAAVWSLLLPSIEQSAVLFRHWGLALVAFGFLCGGAFLFVMDALLPRLQQGAFKSGAKTEDLRRSTKLFIAMTAHNVPESLAVGFAFGVAYVAGTVAAYTAALGVAIGIGIQNFPEGAAVALPMKLELKNNHKAFLYGVLSGAVEPIFATGGIFLAAYLRFAQPWLLAFAAGAMVYVVAEELLPEIGKTGNKKIGAWSVMFGFALMMILDVALG